MNAEEVEFHTCLALYLLWLEQVKRERAVVNPDFNVFLQYKTAAEETKGGRGEKEEEKGGGRRMGPTTCRSHMLLQKEFKQKTYIYSM